MNFRVPLCFFLAFCLSPFLRAQAPACGADYFERIFEETQPALHKQMEALEKAYAKCVRAGALLPQDKALYTLPVVVHIVHQNGSENISDNQVEDAIQHLNDAFANTGNYNPSTGVETPFRFCLATRTPDGNSTTGINRIPSPLTNLIMETDDINLKNLSRWDPAQYVNIWLVREISSLGSGPGVAGYAYLPGSHGQPWDGIVMEARWFGTTPANSGVTIHEMGHYLGLYHTFQGGCVNNDCAADGDRVCDTPPDQSTSWLPCGQTQNSCTTDTDSGFTTDQNDMTINYMDYATLSCYSAFSKGQSDRMEFFLQNQRASLLDSKGCLDPCSLPVSASFGVSAGPQIPAGTIVNFTNTSVNGSTYQWLINGTFIANTPNAAYLFGAPGPYTVELIVTGADPNCTDEFEFTFEVFCDLDPSFSFDPADPEPGNILTATSASPAPQYEWTVNGLPLGNQPTLSFTIPESGNYSICLTVANAYCSVNRCKLVMVADTLPCPSAFVQRYQLVPEERYGWMELELLTDGALLVGGYMNGAFGALTRLQPDGNVINSWSFLKQDLDHTQLIDLAPGVDHRALGLFSSFFSDASPEFKAFCFDPESEQLVWCRKLEFNHPVSSRLILQHPDTKQVWANGRMERPDQTVDQTFLYRFDPADGSVVGQDFYSLAEVPYGLAAVQHAGKVYLAGHVRPSHNTTDRFALACLDKDGSVLWSREYTWPGVAPFGGFTRIRVDNDALVLAGNSGFNKLMVMKTDLNGQELWTRWFQSSFINTTYANGEPIQLNILPDGYLVGSYRGSINQPDYLFARLDKQGNYLGTKILSLSGNLAGLDAVQNDRYVYAITGDFSTPTKHSFLMRFDLNVEMPLFCNIQDSLILTPLNAVTQVVTRTPAPLAAESFTQQDVQMQLKSLQMEETLVCEVVLCNEYCDNGLDDDGDGYVDCFDVEDCPCQTDMPDCYTTDTLGKAFTGRLAWDSGVQNVNSISTPIVANLNPDVDSIPEILVFRGEPGANNDRSNALLIFRGDGANRTSPDVLPIPWNVLNRPVNFPVVGDVNQDGIPELVVVCADRLVRVFTQYQAGAMPAMSLWMTSDQRVDDLAQRPFLADFNADGIPEIYAGTQLFQFDFSSPGGAPQLRRVSGPNQAPYGRLNTTVTTQFTCSPVAADLLRPIDCGGDPDCDGLEIAAGNVIYSVDLNPLDGDPVEIKPQINLNNLVLGQVFSDGYTSIADIDLDGVLDVLVAGRRGNQNGVYAWNKNGLLRFFPYPAGVSRGGGIVAVANVYDDRLSGAVQDLPELLAACENRLVCYNLNRALQTPATPWWWTQPSADLSGSLSVTTFDFNNDRWPEILFRDQDGLRVLYGGPAPFPPGVDAQRNWMTFPLGTGTIDEYPVVADLDNDGEAEVTITGHANAGIPPAGAPTGRLWVFESDLDTGSPWLSARPLWHQFGYFIVNVNDDLTIPKTQQAPHLELPGLGSGKRPYNRFLAQIPLLNSDFEPYRLLPDIDVALVKPDCAGDSLYASVRICNTGDAPMPAGTPIRFYAGDPTDGAANLLPVALSLPEALPADSCIDLPAVLPGLWDTEIAVVVNDDGSRPTPFQLTDDFPVTNITECDYTNNLATIPLGPAPTLELGPDIEVCQNGVWTFHAGDGFVQYRWSTLSSDSFITVYEPGKYWVDVQDWCGNWYSDTVRVTVAPGTVIDLGPDTSFCASAVLSFDVPGFVEYKWTPATGLSCTDCANPTATADSTTTFVVLAKTAIGCYSADSIRIEIGVDIQVQIDTALCAGDTLLWNGFEVPAGGSQIFSALSTAGCDSTTRIQVGILSTFETSAELSICAGDSAFVFGNWIDQPGIYEQTFTAQNGCDSTHRVSVTTLPDFQTEAAISICAGDSAFVFGNWIDQPGIYEQTFTAQNGCDSTHSIAVTTLPDFQTEAAISICAGDSAFVFGNWIDQPGIYEQTFTAQNGCDSTHRVSVTTLPDFQTEAAISICAGDSAFVFGNWIDQPGIYEQTFTAQNGCDSTHSIAVTTLPDFQTEAAISICAGDSAFVFGNWIDQPGIYEQTFTAQNGCDSTHRVSVTTLPDFQTEAAISICAGDSAFVFGNWIDQPGIYEQTFTAQNGCDSTHSIAVTTLPDFQTEAAISICAGDSAFVFGNWIDQPGIYEQTFTAQNGCDSTHRVSVTTLPDFQTEAAISICAGDSAFVFGNWIDQPGIYEQTFTAQNGCDSTHRVSVTTLPDFQTEAAISICAGDSAFVFGNWIDQPGIYEQTFTAQNGCDSTHRVSVTTLPDFQTEAAISICAGDSAFVFGNWIDQPGIYEQTFTAQNGCDSTHRVSVSVSLPTIPAVAWEDPACFGDTDGSIAVTNGQAGFSYSLDGVQFQATPVFEGLGAGVYTLRMLDSAGCEIALAVTLTQPPPLALQMPADTTILLGQSVILAPQTGGNTVGFQWTPVESLNCSDCPSPVARPLETTVYSLVVHDANGCPLSGQTTIRVRDVAIYIPNVFYPGKPGLNEVFGIFGSPGIRQVLYLEVYERWGGLVFRRENFSADGLSGWDGTWRGQDCAPGVYVFVAEVELADGQTARFTGDVTLVR